MYQEFANIYDEFMQTIPYSDWADYVETLWKHHGLKPSLVLDLGCGTGSLTTELCKRGYDMIGADASFEMLTIAREKALQEGLQDKILYLLQDMREFELYGTVQSIICTCDSLNYLLEEDDLAEVFRLAENYLEPPGLFMFDMNTEYKYEKVLGDNVFAETSDDAAFIWENSYYPEEKINEYQVTFFEATDRKNHYERFEETHLQKAYSIDTVKRLLEAAHFTVEGIYDAFTLNPPTETTERVTFVARETRPKRTE